MTNPTRMDLERLRITACPACDFFTLRRDAAAYVRCNCTAELIDIEYVRDEDSTGSPCLCRFDGDGCLVGEMCHHHKLLDETLRDADDALSRIMRLDASDYTPQEAAHAFEQSQDIAHDYWNGQRASRS